ncbi:MAG: hypothetical protein ABI629_08225 [bacterium]
MRIDSILCRFAVASLLIALSGTRLAASAGVPLDLASLAVSPNVTLSLAGTVVGPGDVARIMDTPPTRLDVGALPPGANLTGYLRQDDNTVLFTLDVSVRLPLNAVSPTTFTPRDVIHYSGGNSYAVYFDGAAHGVPDGVAIDALAVADGGLVLSFDGAVTLDGFSIDDADLVAFDPTGGNCVLLFDSRAAGVADGLDLDAAAALADGRLLLSFDGSGTLGGATFDDEDLLLYDHDAGIWGLAFDGSAADPAWAAADLDAVYLAPAATPTPTATASASRTPTGTASATATHIATATPSSVPTATLAPLATSSARPTATATRVNSATASPSQVPATATPSPVPATATRTPTAPPGSTVTAVPTGAASPTVTGSPTATVPPVPPATATPSATPTATNQPSPTPTPTATVAAGATATATSPPAACSGDCNGDGVVSISELIRGVNIALGNTAVADCPAFDPNGDGMVTIDALIKSVGYALAECP